MNIIIPLAGEDNFYNEERGFPKFFVEINDKPLIQHVIENLLTIENANFIFLIKKDDAIKYHLDSVIFQLSREAKVLIVENDTEGAACTALLAVDYIDCKSPIIIANGDQIINVDYNDVIRDFTNDNFDAGAIIFNSIHPRWSYVERNEDGMVIRTSEKKPISSTAIAGFYYFKRGQDFIDGAMSLIKKDSRVNGHFYMSQVFNQLILKVGKIGTYKIDQNDYFSFKTPDGIKKYQETHLIFR